jgi:hypothetical protein
VELDVADLVEGGHEHLESARFVLLHGIAGHALLGGVRPTDVRAPRDDQLLILASPLEDERHLALDHVAMGSELLIGGGDESVEPQYLAFGCLDRTVAQSGDGNILVSLEPLFNINAHPQIILAAVLHLLYICMHMSDFRAGEVDRVPRFLRVNVRAKGKPE